MLSFDTTHALTGCLLHADAHAETRSLGAPPILLLLTDQPLTPTGAGRLRHIRAAAFTLPPQQVAEHTDAIVGVLHDLAARLADLAQPGARSGLRLADGRDPGLDAAVAADIYADLITLVEPGSRPLAWAVVYDDVLADTDSIDAVRRIDAVDVDGRVYQLTRRRGEAHAVVVIDDQPDPDDTPATHPGLAALVAATAQLTHYTRQAAHP